MDIREPLADRMRPENLDEFIGQKHLLGEGKILRLAIERDVLRSLILYGPPSTGKTSLAYIISKQSKSRFIKLNATTAKTSDIKDTVVAAQNMWDNYKKKTILFIDEIHRFNKSQQDTLLPYVENGTIILIGATTENPNYEVNGALLSRSIIFKFEKLTSDDIKEAIRLALNLEKGLKEFNVEIQDEALNHLAESVGGDLRSAYNSLELAVITSDKSNNKKIYIDLKKIEEATQVRKINYDKGASNHYDTMSAFIKSMRGSDSNAALHYFARMLEAGEDPKAIMRRILIHAAEDVGMANPMALVVASSAATALEFCGITEGMIPMAEAIIYICESSKSNSVHDAIKLAIKDVKTKDIGEIPLHLRDSSELNSKNLGNGEGYIYPHLLPGGWTPNQQYLPDKLKDVVYYAPKNIGNETKVIQSRKQRIDMYNKWTTGEIKEV